MKKTFKNYLPLFLFLVLHFLIIAPEAYSADDLNQQIDTLTKKLASAAQGDVLQGSETEVYISLGQLQGILPGNKFEVVRQGQPLRVGDDVIGYEETKVAEVEVERARDKVSICKVLEKSDIPKSGDKVYQLRKKINTLVVGQFSYNQNFNHLTKNLQEKLVTAMANRGMKVVERDQLERVLKEQKLGYSGLVNMESAKKIGQLLGAEGMLLGTISDMGNTITLNARLVDIEIGNAVSAAEVELPKTPLITQLLEIQIEGNMPSTFASSSGNDDSSGNISKKNSYFENDMFRIDVVSFRREGGGVELALKYLNKTKSVIQMGLDHPKENTYLVDDLGNQYSFTKSEMDSHQYDFPPGVPRVSVIFFKDINSRERKFVVSAKYFIMNSNERLFASFEGIALK